MRVENCITIKRIVVIPDNEGKVANLRLYEIQRPAGISPRLALLGMKIGLVHVSKQKFIVKQTLAEWGEQSEEQVLVQNFLQAHTICAVVCSDPRMEKRFCFGGQDRQESFYSVLWISQKAEVSSEIVIHLGQEIAMSAGTEEDWSVKKCNWSFDQEKLSVWAGDRTPWSFLKTRLIWCFVVIAGGLVDSFPADEI